MIPLSMHSYYSLMRGICSPEQICNAAKKMGYQRLALTDTDNLYGLWPFLAACRNAGIKPIVGAELTDPGSGDRVVCLVESRMGYRNLCRLITLRHADTLFDFKSALSSHSKGLVLLVRTPELLKKLVESGVTAAADLSDRPGETAFRMRRLAESLNVPAAVVPGSFFLDPADFQTHRMLRAIDLNTSLSRLCGSDTVSPDAFLASPEVYSQKFAVWPDALAGTEKIAGRLAFTGPDYGLVMPPWIKGQGDSVRDTLRTAAYEGAFRRYGHDLSEAVVERLEHELSVIERKGFSSYFLVVQDIVSQSPRICGRGSGAASLVAYCLGITNVCPVKHNLYFERFLNPGRSD
ncbi:MAG: PHP domain-containing protein, partial [Deltaproteobacteria bacterium]|nr:PHP domain-containing protein [Deltaproteobacteria bacterium]